MNIRDISVSRLKEYENNPRNNDLAVEKVKYSIQRFGFLFPIVVDVNYVIVAGHTRVRACRELGIQIVPCVIADELTEEQINLFRLVDNKTSEYSDWDFEKLKSELACVDLTLEKNQILLDQFEFTAEVFDIEPEQAEIKVSAFNFMGINDKPAANKPSVSTTYTDKEVNKNEKVPEVAKTFDNSEQPIKQSDYLDKPIENEETIPDFSNNSLAANDIKSEIKQDATDNEPSKKSKAVLQFCQFRFGDVSFFISQVELDKMNEKYAEYIDSGAVLKESFASYLLRGVENFD